MPPIAPGRSRPCRPPRPSDSCHQPCPAQAAEAPNRMALRLSPARDWPDPAPPQEAARHVAERHAGDDEPRQTTLTPRTGRLARSIPLLARPSRASGTEPRTRVRGSAPSTGTCRAGTPQEADASRCPASPGQLTGWGTASPAAPRPGPCTRPRTGRCRGRPANPTAPAADWH